MTIAVPHGRRLKPAVSSALPKAGLPVRVLFTIFLIFDFPAFTIQLAMNDAGDFVGSPVMQVMTVGSELFVFALILSSRNVRSVVLQSWPVLALIAISFVSALWSRNPGATIHASNTYMTTALFGVVLVGALPQFQCIKFVIRTMVLGCVLSLLWVFIFPEVAIHQLTDAYQTVHAGLWRGIFSHKQGLGYFAGLTTGLLLFYRTDIFPMPVWAAALGISVTCLLGTQSATGFVAAFITPTILYLAYFIARCPVSLRKVMFVKVAAALVAIGVAYKSGILNFVIIYVLDKSPDLTGRADFWPIILRNFYSSGFSLLGGGYGAQIAPTLSEWSVDNGYIDKFLEFGYVSSPIVFGIFATILWATIRLILRTPSEDARINIFPFAIWSVTLVLNITESNFMTKGLSTVLTSVAVALFFQHEQFVRSRLLFGGRQPDSR
jgi:exopolysaccharide production protein ExoQ